jgi:hypothetical protein
MGDEILESDRAAMTRRRKPSPPTFIPLSKDDLSEALGAVSTMLQGGAAQSNPNNPLLSSILASLEDDKTSGAASTRKTSYARFRSGP